MTARDWLIVLLLADFTGMVLLAAFYLRKRQLPWLGYVFWGLLALIPLVGPFLVIISRPGKSKGS